jgi:hypothetical protein
MRPRNRISAHRPVLAVFGVAAAVLLVPACWDSDSIDHLFGAPDEEGGGGFDPGVGGGLVLRDLFVNARLERDPPTILRTVPENGAVDVSVKTAIALEFSESMTSGTVRTGVSLFQSGSSTSTPVTTFLFQGDSTVVLVPQTDLLPNTQYEVVVASPVSDLQGDAISSGGGGGGASDRRFSFRTIQKNGDPDFEVIYSTPKQQSGEVPRQSESVIVFSEPVDVTSTGSGLNGAGNVVVRRNGQLLVGGGVDYTLTTFPTANPRGAQIVLTARAPANAELEVVIDADVRSADGQETLKGGNGFELRWTAQDTAIPETIAYPDSPLVPDADGAISSVTLHAFRSQVALTTDGQQPESTTIVFFDEAVQNALVFSKNASRPTEFTSDLEPQTSPALQDGDIVVGAYVERRGFRSEVSLIHVLVKDTVGPRLVELGDPNLNPSTLITQVNDPVVHGRMSEECAGVQLDFDGAGQPDFNSTKFLPEISTVEQNLFVSGVTEDAALPTTLEPTVAFSFIASDVFGNVSVNSDSALHHTVGMVGADVLHPDGTSALYVAGYAGDLFQVFTSGAVLIDRFPPDSSGAGQIVRGMSTGNGVVRFSEAELAAVGSAQITVTLLAKRTSGSTTTVFGPLTFAGLDRPTAAVPKAVIGLLRPDPSIKIVNDVQCEIVGESQNNPLETGSAFVDDVVGITPETEKFRTLVTEPTIAENLFDLPLNQLQSFAVTEKIAAGGLELQRFSGSEPFLSSDDSGQFSFSKVRQVDFTGQGTTYSAASHPHLVHEVTFDDASVSTGGSVGLSGSEAAANQLREVRLLARVPGFVGTAGLNVANALTVSGADRIGSVLLPLPLTQNDSVAATGFADSGLELLLQPTLADDAVAVDAAILRRNVRLELIVAEKQSLLGTAASTRERFLIDPAAADARTAAPQAIPSLTLADASHPPLLDWSEVTGGEGMHVLSLVSLLNLQRWTIHVPAGAAATVSMRVPSLPAILPDAMGTVDFQVPGTFSCFVESFDFDPDHLFSAGSTEQYHFDPQRFWQSDFEREFLKASRSDPGRTITTN